MNEKTLQLFKTLTELPGAPGNEHLVRKFMREQISGIQKKSFRISLEASSA